MSVKWESLGIPTKEGRLRPATPKMDGGIGIGQSEVEMPPGTASDPVKTETGPRAVSLPTVSYEDRITAVEPKPAAAIVPEAEKPKPVTAPKTETYSAAVKPYAAGWDTFSPAGPYAAGLQAKEKVSVPKAELTGPSLGQRAWNTVTGGLKGTGASMTNLLGTLYEVGQRGRDRQNEDILEEYARDLEQRQRELDAALEDRDTWSPGDIQSFYNVRDDAQRKYDAAAKVFNRETQRKTTQSTYEAADLLGQSSAEDRNRAKEGLGTMGQIAVDAGAGMVQMAGDAAGALLTGNGLIPFGMRVFGSGSQKARQDGADLKGQVAYGALSTAKELAAEKLFSVALPFSQVYGGGSLDDKVEKIIRQTVEKLADTEQGQKVLGALMTTGAAGFTEGLEEMIGDWAEWQMPRIYGGDVSTAQETLTDSLYDFAVGGMMGLAGGADSSSQLLNDGWESAYEGQTPQGSSTSDVTKALGQLETIMPSVSTELTDLYSRGQAAKKAGDPAAQDRAVTQFLNKLDGVRETLEAMEESGSYDPELQGAYQTLVDAAIDQIVPEEMAPILEETIDEPESEGYNEEKKPSLWETLSLGRKPKLSKREYRMIQSAQMQKYGGMGESAAPEKGYVYAYNKFYLIHSYGPGEFEVVGRFDPDKVKDQEKINRILEAQKHER